MQDAISMEKLPGNCFAGGGANGVGLRRSLWLEVGSVRCLGGAVPMAVGGMGPHAFTA